MCTITFFRDKNQSVLTINRDESRTRMPEKPPEMIMYEGEKLYAPLDGESGGSWVCHNHYGMGACLLNFYPETEYIPKTPISRGEIIFKLLTHRTVEDARHWFENQYDGSHYRPFSLVFFSHDKAYSYRWDGKELLQLPLPETTWFCLSSSSWNSEEVLPWRYEQFVQWRDNGAEITEDNIPSFHYLRPEGMEMFAPNVSRPQTVTTSVTQISVNKDRAKLKYERL